MKEKWEEFKESLTDVVMMSRKEFLLTAAVCVLGGIVFGLFFSPKKTTMFGCNNGNNSGNGNSAAAGESGQEEGGSVEDKCARKSAECDGKKHRCRKWKKKTRDGIADWEEVKEVEL